MWVRILHRVPYVNVLKRRENTLQKCHTLVQIQPLTPLQKEGEIMVFPVVVKTMEDAKRLNQVATQQDFAMYISCDSITIDIRSLLGLLTLLGKESVIIAPDHADPESFIKALRKMKLIH